MRILKIIIKIPLVGRKYYFDIYPKKKRKWIFTESLETHKKIKLSY